MQRRKGYGLLSHYLEETGFFEEAELADAGEIPIDFNSTTGNITDIRYNVVEQDLYVDFHNGSYVYHDVPITVAQGFEGASSATLYLNDQIKDRYSYEQL